MDVEGRHPLRPRWERDLDELAFTTENSHGIAQEVLPTCAVIIGQALNPSRRWVESTSAA